MDVDQLRPIKRSSYVLNSSKVFRHGWPPSQIIYTMQSNNMSLCEFSDRARRRRATVNLSRVLGCHRTTFNRRWNKLRNDFLRRHDLLSFSNFANESTTTVDRENNCHEIPSTVLPSTSCTNERLLEDNECSTVDLPCQKPLSRKEKINRILMHLMTSTYLSIRDADRVLNEVH
uniref:HTH_48 domain-containing protein n=2 Tax=Schistosoma mansoni TaxID=6183 RepID=G4LUS5_SCHMA